MRLSDELRGRTKRYPSQVIHLYSALPRQRKEVEVLGHQLLRSATSVAANVREASRARSDAEFFSKVAISLQEADESLLWLELLAEDCNLGAPLDADLHSLQTETNELISNFVTILSRRRA